MQDSNTDLLSILTCFSDGFEPLLDRFSADRADWKRAGKLHTVQQRFWFG